MLDRINLLSSVKVEILTCPKVMSQLVLLGASWCYLVPVAANVWNIDIIILWTIKYVITMFESNTGSKEHSEAFKFLVS
jgi:hypothetical protein